jgi:ABC-type polysaccharide transport system, permease component
MALPCIVFIILFSYIPLFGWSYAFIKYKPTLSIFESELVGLKNFIKIFTDMEMLPSLRNTLMFSFLGLLTSPIPAIFAIIMSEMKSRAYQKVIQTVTTFPNFISWIVVYAFSLIIFSVDDGILNKVFLNIGLIDKPLNLLIDANITWYLQTSFGLWKGLGFSAIIYFAAIAGIDQELYDAASVDGAGRFRKIWHIKIPGIAPTFIVMFLLGIGSILSSSFDQLYVFRNARVNETIQTIDLYVYKIGIENGNYSFATAVGIIKTFISLLLLSGANLMAKRVMGRSII